MSVENLSNKHFEARDVMELLGIDKNKLFYWINTHRLLKPEIAKASGTGTRVRFSVKNLLELAVIKEMLEFGFDLVAIKKIKRKLDNFKDEEGTKIDVFESTLESHNPEEAVIKMSKLKGKGENYFYFAFTCSTSFPDVEGVFYIPFTYEGEDKSKHKGNISYFSLDLAIGEIAVGLLKKTKE